MYHMIHGICEHAQRISSPRMCNMLYENDACILHTHILICSRYLSRRQSEIIQHRTCHLEAVWACMDNLILWFFSHWNSLPSWTELAQEPSNRLILCWGYFTWKQHLGNTFLTCLYPWEAPFQMTGDSFSWKMSEYAFQWFQGFEGFHVILQRDTESENVS